MYLSHEVVNGVRTIGFVIFAFIGFYFEFLVLLLLLYYIHYILAYHLCSISPVSCFYHIIPCMFPA